MMENKNCDGLLKDSYVDGKHVSPVLPEDVKNYLIDIDGTVCDDIPNEEPERMLTAEVYPDALITCCLLYTSSSPRDISESRMPSSA